MEIDISRSLYVERRGKEARDFLKNWTREAVFR